MKYIYFLTLFFSLAVNNLYADNHEDKKGYVIAFLDVQNKEIMAEYKKMTKPIVKEFGGKLLAANHPDLKEGYIEGVAAIIEFASFDDAKRWYNSKKNQNAKAIRDKGVKTILVILEGK